MSELGGDPDQLLIRAGIRPDQAGDHEAFIPYRSLILAIESAAAATGAADFGRRLGMRQDIAILGPVGVAARTARTVADAFAIFERYLAAYSPAIRVRVSPERQPEQSCFDFRIVIDNPPSSPHTYEVSLAVSLGVFRLLIDPNWTPLSAHYLHEPLSSVSDYESWLPTRHRFADRFAGYILRTADLNRPLGNDDITHRALIDYLDTVMPSPNDHRTGQVREIIRRLLPTGAMSLSVVAEQLNLHPKALQRRLRLEGTTFGAEVDSVRRETARRYLCDTSMTMSHLARELGYAEQSVLSRSCNRWFGCSPLTYRHVSRAARRPTWDPS